MEYQLVPMDRSHLSGVAELERLCFSTPWNETMLEEELFNPTASFIVAEGAEGEVLGYAGLHVVLDEGYIDNVAVRPSCRRQGIGDRLLDVFCRFGQAHLAFLTLEVRPSNQAAGGPVLQAWLSGGGTAKGLLPRSHRGRPFADPDVRPMTLRDLTLQELHHLHRHELREAFPPEELKPFAAMKKLYRAGVYHPVGAWEGETLVGYALLWEAPRESMS